MKVLLLSLPGCEESDGNLFPLGIGYLAAALQKRHEASARHFPLMGQAQTEVPDILRRFRPDLVGFTCSTFNRGMVRQMIGNVRSICPTAKVVVGGVHATFRYDQVLLNYGADLVVIGEGEETFPELCNALDMGRSLDEVAGIAFLRDDKVIVTPRREPVLNLDDLPVPDYSYARTLIESSGVGFLITSRGCPVRCTFCSTSSFWGQKVRVHSPSRVVDEMEMLVSGFGVKKVFFHDDTFNLGIARVKEICAEITRRGLQIEWGCSCRVTPVSEEMITAMVAAGCRHICWGIETGSPSILAKIDKKITLEQIRNAYELSSRFSSMLSVGAFTMVGNPGESAETVKETVTFLNSLPITDAPSTSILYILPGTVLYEELRAKGMIAERNWYRHDSVPFYTLENSYRQLCEWAAVIRSSGARIPFDAQRHFWHNTLEIAPQNFTAARLVRTLLDPAKWRSQLVKRLPAGKIRF